MPHCQKENHNRAAKSKKEKQKAKQAMAERKKKLAEAAATAEAEAALKISNNISPVEGHGAYEIGYEEEPEYQRFNVKKRSKKHLRNDLRKKMLREAQEEEERIKKQQEEEYRQQQKALKEAAGELSSSEEEEEPPVLEYLVYVCECCDKRYATKNQFLNHLNSKKHKHKVKVFESMGLLVTHVELRGENGNEKELYDDYVDEEEDDDDGSDNGGDTTANAKSTRGGAENESANDSDDESEEESDDEYVPAPKQKNVFAAFSAGFSSSSEDEESDDSDNDRKPPAVPMARRKDPPPSKEDEKKDDDHIDFDELIHQNQLIQNEIDAKQQEGTIAELPPTPLSFHETYDPEDYTVNEQRLVSVQHRLRKNLAAKGIEPKKPTPSGYDPMEAITMGKTLLQEVLEANIDTLQQKLDAYRKHKEYCQLMCKQYNLAKGNSKAIASQYVFKQDAADNTRRRANVHHAGSHYHMQAARTMQFGRQKGLMARHSSQGARLQASRMAAKETARMQQGGGGMKIGKTSKKSNQKKRGEAGGSKKLGGKKGKAGAGGD